MLKNARYRLVVVMLGMLLLAACKEQVVKINAVAPDLAVQDPFQKTISLSDYRGQPVVVEFWSPTCGACLVMMKAWQEYALEHPDKMRFIGVGIAPYPKNLAEFAEKLGVSLPLGLDQLGITQERYQVNVTPTTFFIDRNGILKEIHIGYSPTMNLDHYVSQIQN
jgi:thiol-disulfide isomerase/thioredoxin